MKNLNLALLLSVIALSSCSSAGLDRKLDERLNQESQIKTRQDLDDHATQLLKNTPGLTNLQRENLTSLKNSVREKLHQNSQTRLKLHELLATDLLSREDHAQEIHDIEKRLRTLSKQRVDIIFDAVNQANDLLGRSNLIREAMDLQMIEDQGSN